MGTRVTSGIIIGNSGGLANLTVTLLLVNVSDKHFFTLKMYVYYSQ